MNGFNYELPGRTWHLVLTSELRNALYMHEYQHIYHSNFQPYIINWYIIQLASNAIQHVCVGVEKNKNDI